jgi:transcriptional regulator with XRE-family HTH domain
VVSNAALRNNVLRHFGESLREERKRQGISQEQLALLADVNRTYVGGVERGEENISLLTIPKLSAVLKVKPSALLAQAGL